MLSNLDPNWVKILNSGNAKPLLEKTIQKSLDLEVFNKARFTEIFRIFKECSYQKLKAVVIGMDLPSFIKEIEKFFKKKNVDFDFIDFNIWIQQGVLLLSGDLVKDSLWTEYTRKILQRLSVANPQIHYMLLDNHSSKLVSGVFNKIDSTKIIEYDIKSVYDFIQNLNEIYESEFKWGFTSVSLKEHSGNFLKELLLKEDPRLNIFDKDRIVIFTDGSCNPNKRCKEAIAGYASLIILNNSKTLLYGKIDNTKEFATNIRAEGFAILNGLKHVLKMDQSSWTSLTLISDCELWCNMINLYMDKWDSEKFRTSPNPDLTLEIHKVWNQLKEFSFNDTCLSEYKSIERDNKIIHMKSHNKTGWKNYPKSSYEWILFNYNDIVDKQASEARKTLNNGENGIENYK